MDCLLNIKQCYIKIFEFILFNNANNILLISRIILQQRNLIAMKLKNSYMREVTQSLLLSLLHLPYVPNKLTTGVTTHDDDAAAATPLKFITLLPF